MDVNTLLRLERERADAVMARDIERLRPLLADDLVYIHATGVRHGKPQLLDFVQHGPRFLQVDVLAPQVTVIEACTALLTGELQLQIQRSADAPPVLARSWVSQVWVRATAAEGGWQLRVFQSTRRDD